MPQPGRRTGVFVDESVLPPETLLLGASSSQEVKCFALGHEERSSPHSAISFRERYGPRPWIVVMSFPSNPNSAARTSKARAFA